MRAGTAPDEAADPVAKDEIVKGYEYRKGEYITIEPSELEHLRVPSKHTMEVTQFVDGDPRQFPVDHPMTVRAKQDEVGMLRGRGTRTTQRCPVMAFDVVTSTRPVPLLEVELAHLTTDMT